LGIDEFYNQPVRQLSLGQRMRADLCASLLHSPSLLFLDEPTIGLDVVVKKQIREMIKDINSKQGVTVILTTHDMKDIEEICQRIILINKGQIIIDLPVSEVKNKFMGNTTIIVDFDKTPNGFNIPVDVISKDGNRWVMSFDPREHSSGKILAEIVQKYSVLDLSIKESEIDDIIRNLYAHVE
jgi:ABC-2 type transport system ATP-binding protein